MAKDLTQALTEVEITYEQIKNIAEDMLKDSFKEVNALVKDLENNISTYSTEFLRDRMLRLQVLSFNLSELRDKTSIKAECSEIIRKEAYAVTFIGQEGTAAQKDSNTLIAISENIVVQCLYELIASMVKTKIDQIHRLVDVIKSVLVSKMQEAKLAAEMTE